MDNSTMIAYIVAIALIALLIAAEWKIFTKARIAGWKSLIPIYSEYLMFKLSWGNGWLFLMQFIPIVGIVFTIIQLHKLSKSFGHGVGYTLGLIFLPEVFIPVLGFSGDKYVGPIN